MRQMVQEDIPELKILWEKTFGDDAAYIDLFFEDIHRPDGGLVIREKGTLAAMGFLVPIGEYDGRKCLMTYAVACDPRFRGKGYGGKISRELMRLAGDGAVICPADEGLFDFYRDKAGYKTAFFTEKYTLCGDFMPDKRLEPIAVSEYAVLREKHLLKIPHIVFGQRAIHHQKQIGALTGGGLFRIEDGCCAVEVWKEKIVVKELLVSDIKKAACLIGRAFKGSEITVRCPAERMENARPFAMAGTGADRGKPLPWFGFAFD